MKSSKSPIHLLIGVILIALSIGMGCFFFGRPDTFFNNTSAGSAIGIASACFVVFAMGVSTIFSYLWSLLPEKKEE
jgi:hypothetical protein